MEDKYVKVVMMLHKKGVLDVLLDWQDFKYDGSITINFNKGVIMPKLHQSIYSQMSEKVGGTE